MDLLLLKQFFLWRGDKKIVLDEKNLQTANISSVFKVSTFYCKVRKTVESTKVTLDLFSVEVFDTSVDWSEDFIGI